MREGSEVLGQLTDLNIWKPNMKILLILLLLLTALSLFVAYAKSRMLAGGDSTWPFYAKKPLTQPEQVLYHRLVRSLPECMVLTQVQLSRVLGVKKGSNFHEWNNRINRISLDFVVCLKDSTVVVAIELDDKTHERADRRQADAKKEKALKSAGIPLIRWHVHAMPDEAAIRLSITG